MDSYLPRRINQSEREKLGTFFSNSLRPSFPGSDNRSVPVYSRYWRLGHQGTRTWNRTWCFHFCQASCERWAEGFMLSMLDDRLECSGHGEVVGKHALGGRIYNLIAVFRVVPRRERGFFSFHTTLRSFAFLCFQAWVSKAGQGLCWCTIQKIWLVGSGTTLCRLGKTRTMQPQPTALFYNNMWLVWSVVCAVDRIHAIPYSFWRRAKPGSVSQCSRAAKWKYIIFRSERFLLEVWVPLVGHDHNLGWGILCLTWLFHSQVQKVNSPNLYEWGSNRIGSIILFQSE